MSIAIAGGTGNIGQYVTAACLSTPFRGSFNSVKLLTRDPNTRAARELVRAGAEAFIVPLKGPSTDVATVAALLSDVHVLIDCQSGGHEGHRNKDALLEAAKVAGVKYYIPSEFGIDHRTLDFQHPEWEEKKRREKTARGINGMHVVSVYPGLFLEDSFGPWFGFDTEKGVWEAVGSPDTKFSLTSKADLGLTVASIASLCIRGVGVPTHCRIGGVTTTASSAAATFTGVNHHTGLLGKIIHKLEPGKNGGGEGSHEKTEIKVTSVPLDQFKQKVLASNAKDAAQYLRLIIGEGKLDHSHDSQNDAVNGHEQAWKWTTLEDYAKSVHGRPWCSDTAKDARTPLQQVREKLAIPETRHSAITADISQSQAQTSHSHPAQTEVRGTSLP